MRVESRESRTGSESVVEGRLGLSRCACTLECRWLRYVEHRFLENVLRVRNDSLRASLVRAARPTWASPVERLPHSQ